MVKNMAAKGVISLDMEDDIVKGILTTINGEIVHKGALEAMNK